MNQPPLTKEDKVRLGRQCEAVRLCMLDGEPRTLRSISWATGASEASVSARLRELRKKGYQIDRKQVANGLFMPQGLSATWLMMIDPQTNEPRPVYVEPEIIVSPFPLGTSK